MRLQIFLIALLLFGCGQDFKADISMTTIAWQGSLETDPTMLQIFNQTAVCIADYGFQRTGYPYVIVTNGIFLCNGIFKYGCTVFNENRIYIYKELSCLGALGAIINNCDSSLLRHEIIHWITLQEDDAHSQPYFTQCEDPANYPS